MKRMGTTVLASSKNNAENDLLTHPLGTIIANKTPPINAKLYFVYIALNSTSSTAI
jgi:hypothetical protein